MTSFRFLITFYYVVLSSALHLSHDELVYLQVIFRHGISAPDKFYPDDPNESSFSRPGDLTLRGKLMSYKIGEILRSYYEDFLTSSPNEVDFESCTTYPCALSSLALAASLYAPDENWEFKKGLKWQPIAISYGPVYLDSVKFSKRPCPNGKKEYDRLLKSSEAQEILGKYKKQFDYWSSNSKWSVKDWDKVADLYELLKTEKRYDCEMPKWVATYWKDLETLANLSYVWNYKTRKLQKLRGGPLVQRIVNGMETKISNSNFTKKIAVYSTHSSNIAAFLSGLKVFDKIMPDFSDSIIIELYKHDGEYYVRFLHMKSSAIKRKPHIMHTMHLEGCSGFCPLDTLKDQTKDMMQRNWMRECVSRD